MKKIYFLAPVITACLFLAGCGSVNTKTEEGMQQISALQYSDALVLFDEASEEGENPKLIARGRGIALLGQTEYEKAAEQFLTALSIGTGLVRDIDYDINYYLADSSAYGADHGVTIVGWNDNYAASNFQSFSYIFFILHKYTSYK